MNLFYYRANMAVFEVLLGIILLPAIFLPIPGQPDVQPSELGDFLRDAARCFAGLGVSPDGGSCSGTWQVWLLWVAVGLVSIMAELALMKYGSAVLSSILSAVNVPVTVAYFQWEALAGPVVQHGLHWNTWAAVAVATAGALLYTSGKEQSAQRQLSLADAVPPRLRSHGSGKQPPADPPSTADAPYSWADDFQTSRPQYSHFAPHAPPGGELTEALLLEAGTIHSSHPVRKGSDW